MIQPDDLRPTLIRLLAVELSVAEERIAAARSLRDDLGMDSIAAANLLFAIEEEFGVEIDDIPPIESLTELEAALRGWLASGRS